MNIVNILEVELIEDDLYVLLEFMNEGWCADKLTITGNLENLFAEQRNETDAAIFGPDAFGLPEKVVRLYGIQILEALQFLHAQGVVYGYLKCSNVYLDSEGEVKLADLFSTVLFDN